MLRSDKSVFYYSEQQLTSFQNTNAKKAAFYPNQVSGYVGLCIPSNASQGVFEVSTILGSKLLSKKVSNNEQLELHSLKAGMYPHKLNVKGLVQSGVLVKQ